MSGRARAGFRERWIEQLWWDQNLGNSTRVLLLWLARRMGANGYIEPFYRDEIAVELNIADQRVAERIGEAKQAGYLDLVDGGVRGRRARYVAVLPSPPPRRGPSQQSVTRAAKNSHAS